MNIRHVTEQDREAWLAMRHALWPEGSIDEHREEIDSFFAGSLHEPLAILVAERDGQIVGFAELSIRSFAEGCETNRIAYLEGWYVAPPFRRFGIGRALVATAERWGISQGCREFASDTQVDNEDSRAAHLACGFEEVAVIRCFKKALRVVAAREKE